MSFWRRRQRDVDITTSPIYRYLTTQQPSAGAMRYAFVSRQGLPASSPFGNGRVNGWVVDPLTFFAAQSFVQHGTTMQGYGGVVAGQLFTQPLISQG